MAKGVSMGWKRQKMSRSEMGIARDKGMSSSRPNENSVAGAGHHQRVGFVSTAQHRKQWKKLARATRFWPLGCRLARLERATGRQRSRQGTLNVTKATMATRTDR